MCDVTEEQMGFIKILELKIHSRKRNNMSTICSYCRKDIEDDTFIAVITEKTDNFMFHRTCYPASTFDNDIWADGDPDCGECSRPYHRHYDSYEECEPVGCKYCGCNTWVPPKDWTYPKEKKDNK